MTPHFRGAGADEGDLALGWTNAGDGALYASDPGGETDETDPGQKAGKNETTPFIDRRDRMRKQICHFSRTDPFPFRREMLERMEGRLSEHHSGELRQESAESRAERIAGEELTGWAGRRRTW